MLFFNEADTTATDNVDVDGLQNKDPETSEGVDNIAAEIEDNMQGSALEAMSYFEGGEAYIKECCQPETANALLEARKMSKRTLVRLGKNDDLTRRINMGCLILAREKKDPLFNKLALNRVKERDLRKKIFKKYHNQAKRIALISQRKHIKDMKKLPAINFNAYK